MKERSEGEGEVEGQGQGQILDFEDMEGTWRDNRSNRTESNRW